MGKYVWPCPSYSRISSGYGNRTCPFHGKEFHDGVDLASASGTPILAFGPGTVTKSGWYGGYGNYISIDHGGGLMSFYGHASALYVRQGAKVTAGQKIAAVGTTGSSTGCHLHFHLVPKYRDGFEWGGVFAMNPKQTYLTDEQYAEMIEKIKSNL